MHYLTNYYKNRCDQLQEQVNHLTKLISETEEFIPPNEWFDSAMKRMQKGIEAGEKYTPQQLNDLKKYLERPATPRVKPGQPPIPLNGTEQIGGVDDFYNKMQKGIEAGEKYTPKQLNDLEKWKKNKQPQSMKPSAPEIQSREPNLKDYQRLIKYKQGMGSPAAEIEAIRQDMFSAGKRHGIDLERPNAPWGKTPTPTLANAVKGVGAGIVGGLAGEYLVKPAAEKAGVFDAVGKVSRNVMSGMPDWAVNAADVGLGLAQGAIDPIGTYNEFLGNQARKSPPPTAKDREAAEARYNKQNF